MGRKLLIIFSSFVFLLGIFATRVFAQETSVDSVEPAIGIPDILPPYPRTEPGFLGQDHDYSLVFRGNGEAVVSIRVVLTNKGEEELSEISLRVPKVAPTNFSVYQVIREPVCIRYGETTYPNLEKYKNLSGTCPIYTTVNSCDRAQAQGEECSWYFCANSCLQTGSLTSEVCDSERSCAEYQEPDYYSYYGQSKYQKAEYDFSGDTLLIILPVPIEPQKSGSFFVYYRTFGYANQGAFGVFTYEFESFKADDDVRNLRVGINTDSDLVLRGAEGEVQYRFADVSEETFSAVGGASPLESTAVDTFYRNIGQGRIIKVASNLAPLESYSVQGSYADNKLKLFAKEILIGLSIFVVLVLIVALVIRLVVKKIGIPKKPAGTKSTSSDFTKMALISGGIGFISSIIIAGYTLVVILLGGLISNVVSYQYNSIVVLFLVLISFGVYSLLLFGPALYLGVKKGIGWGISAAILTVFWLFIFFAVALLVIFLLGASSGVGPIRPLPLLESFPG